MVRIYFVRHAQPDFSHSEDLTRPLTNIDWMPYIIELDFEGDKNRAFTY